MTLHISIFVASYITSSFGKNCIPCRRLHVHPKVSMIPNKIYLQVWATGHGIDAPCGRFQIHIFCYLAWRCDTFIYDCANLEYLGLLTTCYVIVGHQTRRRCQAHESYHFLFPGGNLPASPQNIADSSSRGALP